MNISLSEEMHSFVLERVRAGCHSSASEYIRSLIRRDRSSIRERDLETPTPRPIRRANDLFTNTSNAIGPIVAEP